MEKKGRTHKRRCPITATHRHASVILLAKSYIHPQCLDTKGRQEDLPRADGWRKS